MGNKIKRRSSRLETTSPERETNNTQIVTPNQGNETLTNFNVIVQEVLGDGNSEDQLTEPSLISNKTQVWTQMFERKSNNMITKIREEIDNKLETIIKEIRTNKNATTATNPRSETLETQNSQTSGSKTDRSIGFRPSNTENSDSEDEDYALRPSEMKDWRHSAQPL